MSWSRRNSTRCLSSWARISANRPSSWMASASLTPTSSAPMAQVSCSTCMAVASSDDEDRRAGGLARLQVAVGLHSVLQGVVLVDLDLDATAADVIEQLAGQVGLLGRIGDVVGQRRTGHVQRALHRQQHWIERRDRPGGGADADQQAAALERVQRGHEGVLADAVEHHVDADAIGQLAHALGDVLVAVVDGVVAAMGAGDFGLGLGGHGADHGQAEQLGPLRDDQADTAGGGVQQDGVAGLEVVDAAHQVGRGQAAHGHRRGGLEGDGFRQLDQRRGRDQALGRVGAEGVEKAGVGDAIADRHVGDALAHRFHHAGGFHAHAVRQRDRVGAVAEVGIGVVQADRHVAQADLTGTGFADLDVLVAQNLWTPGFIEAYGFGHVSLPNAFLLSNTARVVGNLGSCPFLRFSSGDSDFSFHDNRWGFLPLRAPHAKKPAGAAGLHLHAGPAGRAGKAQLSAGRSRNQACWVKPT
ncbi:hypothetical protein OF001_U230019 [Pseudomonas sp. OF001]|nr:hypothetical protein OF001_U230019 [Pseudomonas sp. OF001]